MIGYQFQLYEKEDLKVNVIFFFPRPTDVFWLIYACKSPCC